MEGLIYKAFNSKIFLVCLLICSAFVNGQTQPKSIVAKFSDAKIILDGKIDEPEWKLANQGANFWQFFPTDSMQAKYQTSFKVLYSETNLYVAIRAESPNENYGVQREGQVWAGVRSPVKNEACLPQVDFKSYSIQ